MKELTECLDAELLLASLASAAPDDVALPLALIRHASRCAACAEVAAVMLLAGDALRDLPDPTIPGGRAGSGMVPSEARRLVTVRFQNPDHAEQKLQCAAYDVVLTDGILTLGTSDDCDIVLIDDPTVSRHHAVVEVCGEVVFLEDLGSTNGVTYRGEPVTARMQVAVDAGEGVVGIGRYRIDISVLDAASLMGALRLLPGRQLLVGWIDSDAEDGGERTVEERANRRHERSGFGIAESPGLLIRERDAPARGR